MKPLLMMRTRGLSGPFFSKFANSNTLAKSAGNALRSVDDGATGSPVLIADLFNPPDGVQGLAYNYNASGSFNTNTGEGGQPVSGWALGGTWPAGLSINSSGVISGAPTDSGLFTNLTVIASNSQGTTPTAIVDVSITAAVAHEGIVVTHNGEDVTHG